MPKPVYATASELEEAVKKLEGAISKAEGKIGPAVKASENALKGELGKVAGNVTENAKTTQQAVERCGKDAKGYTDNKVTELRNEIMGMMPVLENKIESAESSLTNKLNEVDTQVRQALADELSALCERIDKEFNATRADLTQQDENHAQTTANNLAEQRAQLDASIQAALDEAQRQINELQASSQKALEAATNSQARADQLRDEKSERSGSEIWLKLNRLDELLQELEQNTTDANNNLRDESNANLQRFANTATSRLDGLDEEGLKIRSAMLEVENLATRRVDWVIKDASMKLRPNSASKASLHTSWFSPKFDMAGVHGLQLEMQLFRPSDFGAEGESSGDVAIYLWACKGMNLVFKLFCGGKSQTCEKVFNGRVPFGTTRFCWLKDTINREDDTLKIGVEILEAIREVEHVVKPVPPPTAEELKDASQLEKELAEKMAIKQVPGSLVFKRHVNNRLLEQVKGQVDAMRSRMVRRVEWRVEQASKLRRCFPPGESMCSASFNAAGIENMQLIFYPNGYGGATDGFCSLYLYAPAGSTLKCNLLIGDQKRDANHTYEVAGAFGRTNFCRFDAGIDQVTDTMLIALEVDEAHQDLSATVAHPKVVPGDSRTAAQIDGAASGPIESTVKLQQAAGAMKSKSLEENKILPSLWTAKSLADSDGKAPGFHSFDELGKTRGGGGRRGGGRGFSPSSPGSMGHTHSQSMASLKDDSQLFSEGPPGVPLPKLTKTMSGTGTDWGNTGSDWSIGGRSSGPGRKGLPKRSRSQVTMSPMASTEL
eukprot:TRINITY_DN3856_c0_g1_i2.p1 TRINITY_DN3856_c0_g1~~TRINITY_DN3856_c0_g1_i2.p1  ORF type:complete len:775 (-),score=205.44 TRINITY_DN3856_c0_g1_i2:138-2462(-)